MANRGNNIQLSQEDINTIELNASRSAHRLMMDSSSVKGGARKSKKAYDRKRKHQKNDWQ